MLQALPENRSLGALCQLAVEFKVLDFVAAQDGLDHSAVALRQHVAERKKLFVVGQSAGHRLAVFAHMTLIAIRGNSQRAPFHGFQDETAHLLDFFSSRLTLHRLFAHHVVANGDMAHQPADVNADFAL